MKTALSQLCNLTLIRISDPDPNIDTSRPWGAVSTTVLHPTWDFHSYCYDPVDDRRLRLFLKVAALVKGLNVKELIVEEELNVSLQEVGLNTVENEHLLATRPSLVHITYLDIPVGKVGPRRVEFGAASFDLDGRPYKLANMLRGMPLLQDLILRNSGYKNFRVKIWPALAAIEPGHLKSISLECCILTPSALRKFFSGRAKTLR